MTAHEFARELLAGPDIPIMVSASTPPTGSDEYVWPPVTEVVIGESIETGKDEEILLISGEAGTPLT